MQSSPSALVNNRLTQSPQHAAAATTSQGDATAVLPNSSCAVSRSAPTGPDTGYGETPGPPPPLSSPRRRRLVFGGGIAGRATQQGLQVAAALTSKAFTVHAPHLGAGQQQQPPPSPPLPHQPPLLEGSSGQEPKQRLDGWRIAVTQVGAISIPYRDKDSSGLQIKADDMSCLGRCLRN